MSDPWTDRWNERFRKPEFAYGESPNEFFQEQLDKLHPGKILLPAEGEGRNGVYAARQGWEVSAFDISVEGKNKALRLAEKHTVTLDYRVGELSSLPYAAQQFDAMALIFAHFPAEIKSSMHRALDQYVRTGGIVIVEAFSKNHLRYNAKNEKVGGPRDIDMLFSMEEIKSDFPNYHIRQLEEKVVYLNEGPFHSGTGSVIRFVGHKK